MSESSVPAGQKARKLVAIVPHTHWDREWYSPFQTFRLRLVDLLDEFLPRLESDLSYAHFLLDGQMAVVDDYLEVRPEAKPMLQRLAATGRLAMGPWYTLPDEFLVSGETHIRNLELGLRKAVEFGGAMEVGYLPDMFGHIAQMPQILKQFGFDHSIVWRGVPAAVNKTAFWWSAPDGTTVRAQYLARGGYGNGAAIPDDAKALVRRVEAHEAEVGDMGVGGILFMNGTDHQVPQPWLGRVVAEANDMQSDYEFKVTSLADFLHGRGAPTEGLAAWKGELRAGARANLLMGVTSNRTDVRQRVARAERALEREAEPLAALFFPVDDYPRALLELAWLQVIRNAAHDSVCACSVDEVVDAVNHRYDEARQIADGITERALRFLSLTLPDGGSYVVNPSAHPRGGVVELVLSDDAAVPGTQVIRARAGGDSGSRRMRPSDVASLLGQIRGQRLSDNFFVNAIDVEEDEDGVEIVLRLGTARAENAGVEDARRALYARLGERSTEWYRVRTVRPPMQRLLVRIDDLEGYGWRGWAPASAVAPANPVTVADGGAAMSNGLVDVEVDVATGTFSINGVAGFNRLVDGGDQGDTYNYCPPAAGDVVIDVADSVAVELVEPGPVRAAIAITRTYTWPDRVDDGTGERAGSRPIDVVSLVQLQAGESMARVTTTLNNQHRDHRLRAVFPLAERASSSDAECAFAIVERGLEGEGGPSEPAMSTFPSRRFVRAGGVTVVHEGLLEYEVIGGGIELALTLIRATGWLSRGPMSSRPEPAGPVIEAGDAQMQGPITVRYAVHVGDADPYALADDLLVPLRVVRAPGGGDRPASGSALGVSGAEVSALRRINGKLELRVFNPSAAETTADLGDRRGWTTDLRGRPIEPFDGAVVLGPWKITTLRIDE